MAQSIALPEEFHHQRSLAGYITRGLTGWNTTKETNTFTLKRTNIFTRDGWAAGPPVFKDCPGLSILKTIFFLQGLNFIKKMKR